MEQAFDPLDASSSALPDDTSGAGAYGMQGWPALVEPSRLVPLPSSMSAGFGGGASATADEWPPLASIPPAPSLSPFAGAPAAGARQGTLPRVFSPAERAEAAQDFALLDTAAERLEQHIDETARDAGIPAVPAADEPELPLAEIPAATESGHAEPWSRGAYGHSD
jgi:hypothetical protein